MKRKGMIITLGAILVLLIGVFVASLTSADNDTATYRGSDNGSEQAGIENEEQ